MNFLWTLAPSASAFRKNEYPYHEWELHNGKKVVKVYKTDLATAQVQAQCDYPRMLMRTNYVPTPSKKKRK